jgi:hypothetical protein
VKPLPVSILLVILLFSSCTPPAVEPPRTGIPGEPVFESLRLKADWKRESERQSGRLSWHHDAGRGKLLIFDPFNRPLLEIQCVGEEVTVLNHRRKRFWQGGFRQLLERMWGVSLTLAELRAIVENGQLPDSLADRPDLHVEIVRHAGAAKRVSIDAGLSRLELRVLKRETRPGSIAFLPRIAAMMPADMDEVLFRD